MIIFPFYCPACEQVADAKADPVGLLFAAKGFTVQCSNCETIFKADIQVTATGQKMQLRERVQPEDASE